MRILARSMVLAGLLAVGLSLPGRSRADEGGKPSAAAPDERELARGQELWKRASRLLKEGHAEEALTLAKEALDIEEREHGAQAADTALALRLWARFLAQTGRRPEARSALERALAIAEKAQPAARLVEARVRCSLAMLLEDLDEFEAALEHEHKALVILEVEDGPEGKETAAVLGNRAQTLQHLGRFDEALPLLRRVLAIDEKVLGPKAHSTAISLSNLASLLQDMGRYREARAHYARAYGIVEESFAPDDPFASSIRGNYGTLLFEMGAPEAALPLFERALADDEADKQDDGAGLIASLGNLASARKMLGQYDAARTLYERALATSEKVWGPEHLATANCVSNLGLMFHEMERSAEALPLLERAARLFEKQLGPDHPLMGIAWNNLASALEGLGRYEDALGYHRRSVDLRTRVYGVDHPMTARALDNMGVTLQYLKRPAEALEQHRKALAILERLFGPDSPEQATTLGCLASASSALGDKTQGRALFDQALAGYERTLRSRFTALTSRERLALARTLRRDVDERLRFAREQGEAGYDVVLRWKGIVSRAEAEEQEGARSLGGPGAALRADLEAAQRGLSGMANAVPPATDAPARADWQSRYAGKSALVETLRRRMAELAAKAGAPAWPELGVAELRRALRDDEALVDVLRVGDEYMAWIVTRAADPLRIELGSATSVEDAVLGITGPSQQDPGQSRGLEEPSEPDPGLPARVWAPIARQLPKGLRRLYLCPDAALAAVPYAALPGAKPGTLLCDEVEIVHLAWAQDLTVARAAAARGTGALVIGDIDYSRAEVSTQASSAPAVVAAAGSADRAPRGRLFTPLGETRGEIQAVNGLLGKGAEILSGANATEAALRARVAGRRVIHLATHGFVRTDLASAMAPAKGSGRWLGGALESQLTGYDPMCLAGLAFAGANDGHGGGEDDGILTAAEVATLDLRAADLVVLSACETARGSAALGEGVLGMVRGFRMAGAGQVVASLWKVDDAATRALMTDFYARRARGADSVAALRAAQETVRKNPRWAKPYYWAAWTIWGPAH